MTVLNAVSLFSSIGIAEYYLKDIGINVVLANEIDSKRAKAHLDIYPSTEIISGDITDKDIRKDIILKLKRSKNEK